MTKTKTGFPRRTFLKNSLKTAAGAVALSGFPSIVPASVFGKYAPSNRINVGAIGTGRISRTHDMPGILQFDKAKIIAVCDLDSKRVKDAKVLVDGHYARKTEKKYEGTRMYEDYRELLNNKDIDAVVISTPDHWHALPAIHAVRAGKDVYLQKPTSLTISEGRKLSEEVHKTGRILQIGSQQRSSAQFKRACELVRNGRIGKVHTVIVGLPIDPMDIRKPAKEMPIPENLNYDMWLGSTPEVFYTEERVHPQADYGRPGWLRCEQFGAGMITGWGVHHFDIVNWGLGTEFTGPVEISATADFPPPGVLWDVHGPYQTQFKFENGVKVVASDKHPNGVKFIGSKGWIFVSRGSYTATASDPTSNTNSKALDASDKKILASVIGEDEIHLYESSDHHGNWLDCVTSRRQPITPVEVGHRACSMCLLSHAAMKLERTLYWDPIREKFRNDEEANAMLSRPQRWPYQII